MTISSTSSSARCEHHGARIVSRPAVAQRLAARRHAPARARAVRRRRRGGAAAALELGEGRGDERQVAVDGVHRQRQLAGLELAVEPGDVEGAGAELLVAQQGQEERHAGRHALDAQLGERAAQPVERLRAVRAPDDQLAEHGVVVDGHLAALVDADVVAHAGTLRPAQQLDAARRGREVAVGVLGVEPHLDGVAARLRRRGTHGGSGSPCATAICARTRSRPVTSSVTGCSTCRRVFISRK